MSMKSIRPGYCPNESDGSSKKKIEWGGTGVMDERFVGRPVPVGLMIQREGTLWDT